jgi:hypothetical protein
LRAMRENSRVHTEHFSSISLQNTIFTIHVFEGGKKSVLEYIWTDVVIDG